MAHATWKSSSPWRCVRRATGYGRDEAFQGKRNEKIETSPIHNRYFAALQLHELGIRPVDSSGSIAAARRSVEDDRGELLPGSGPQRSYAEGDRRSAQSRPVWRVLQ